MNVMFTDSAQLPYIWSLLHYMTHDTKHFCVVCEYVQSLARYSAHPPAAPAPAAAPQIKAFKDKDIPAGNQEFLLTWPSEERRLSLLHSNVFITQACWSVNDAGWCDRMKGQRCISSVLLNELQCLENLIITHFNVKPLSQNPTNTEFLQWVKPWAIKP